MNFRISTFAILEPEEQFLYAVSSGAITIATVVNTEFFPHEEEQEEPLLMVYTKNHGTLIVLANDSCFVIGKV